jgi:hypothetical protein
VVVPGLQPPEQEGSDIRRHAARGHAGCSSQRWRIGRQGRPGALPRLAIPPGFAGQPPFADYSLKVMGSKGSALSGVQGQRPWPSFLSLTRPLGDALAWRWLRHGPGWGHRLCG